MRRSKHVQVLQATEWQRIEDRIKAAFVLCASEFRKAKFRETKWRIRGWNLWQQLRALTGAERRFLEAVLIHKHRARSSPRVTLAPRSLLYCFVGDKHRGWLHLARRLPRHAWAIRRPRWGLRREIEPREQFADVPVEIVSVRVRAERQRFRNPAESSRPVRIAAEVV